MIIGEIRRYLRDNNSIRVSRSLRDIAYKALQAKERLVNQNSKEPTVEEIAKELGLQRQEVVFALDAIQERGRLFVAPGEEVYEGMIVGENPRQEDIPVNATKAKQLTNFRSQGEGKGIQLTPPVKLSLERAIEYIAPDEFVEVTPKNLRLRKRILSALARRKQDRAERKAT
jgi:predicted membrane GTPase involved in stress response